MHMYVCYDKTLTVLLTGHLFGGKHLWGQAQMTSTEIFGIWTPSLPLVSTKSTQPPFLWSEIGQPPPPCQRRRHMYLVPYAKLSTLSSAQDI